jgi:hypothetical protein
MSKAKIRLLMEQHLEGLMTNPDEEFSNKILHLDKFLSLS